MGEPVGEGFPFGVEAIGTRKISPATDDWRVDLLLMHSDYSARGSREHTPLPMSSIVV